MSFKDFDVYANALATQQDVRGMTFFEFLKARIVEHMFIWFCVLAVSALVALGVARLVTDTGSTLNWFYEIIAIAFMLCVVVCLCFVFAWLILPAIFPVIALLAFVSVCIEAVWRIRNDCPYVMLQGSGITFTDVFSFIYSGELIPKWFLPLAAGLFIGHMWWGGDD
jgi:hypothetical protein